MLAARPHAAQQAGVPAGQSGVTGLSPSRTRVGFCCAAEERHLVWSTMHGFVDSAMQTGITLIRLDVGISVPEVDPVVLTRHPARHLILYFVDLGIMAFRLNEPAQRFCVAGTHNHICSSPGREVSEIAKKEGTGIKRVNVNLELSLHNAFRAATAAQGMDTTTVLQKFIEGYVDKYESATARKGRRV